MITLRASLLLLIAWAACLDAAAADGLPTGAARSDLLGLVIERDLFVATFGRRITRIAPRTNSRNRDADWIELIPTGEPDRYRKALWVPRTIYPLRGAAGGAYRTQVFDENERARVELDVFRALGGHHDHPYAPAPAWRPVQAYVLARVYEPMTSVAAIGNHLDHGVELEDRVRYCAFLETLFNWPIANSVLAANDHGFLSREFALASTGDALLFLSLGGGGASRAVMPLVTGHMGLSVHRLSTASEPGERLEAAIDIASDALDLVAVLRPLSAGARFAAPPPGLAGARARYAAAHADPDRVARGLTDPLTGEPLFYPALHESVKDALAAALDPQWTPLARGMDVRAHCRQLVAGLPDGPAKQALLRSPEYGLVMLTFDPIDVAKLGSTTGGRHVKVQGRPRAQLNSDALFNETHDTLETAFHELLHSQIMANELYAAISTLKVIGDDGYLMGRTAFLRTNIQRLIRQEAEVTIRSARFAQKIKDAGGTVVYWPEHERILELADQPNTPAELRLPSQERFENVERYLLDSPSRHYRRRYEDALIELWKRFEAVDRTHLLEGVHWYSEDVQALLDAP